MRSVAVPRSRCSIKRLWMYSVAPMSTPRVGWHASKTFGFAESSRARITFWIFPPERLDVGVSTLGVLTPKSSTNFSQCLLIAPKASMPRRVNFLDPCSTSNRFSPTVNSAIAPSFMRSSEM